MKLPRDISGSELAEKLKVLGYVPTRQTGSHLRLTTREQGEHHITIPQHRFLRVGTLDGILLEVARHFRLTHEELVQRLFGEHREEVMNAK